jgi:CheY-like chemotaxis protein
MRKRIAVLDDDAPFGAVLRELLSDDGYDLLMLAQPARAYQAIRSFVPHVIVLDLHFGGSSGLQVLDGIRSDPFLGDIPVIVCSVDTAMLARESALLDGYGYHVLVKPFELDALEGLLARLLAGAIEDAP